MNTEFKDFLVPIQTISAEIAELPFSDSRFVSISKNYQQVNWNRLRDSQIAILGVPEDRNSNNQGSALAPDKIRFYLYQLFMPREKIRIFDMGNLKQGKTPQDTYTALTGIIFELLKENIFPILLGGSQDLTYAVFTAYEKLAIKTNIVTIDSRLDIGEENKFSSHSYMNRIITERSDYFEHYSNIGYQTYLVPQFEIDIMEKLYMDAYRLGAIKNDIREAEPIIRDADLLSVDISSIRQSEAPGNMNTSPNGFLPEELCQMARYAGMSDKLRSFGIFEVNPLFDHLELTAHLSAQIIWHFTEGFSQRKNDYPKTSLENYKKFIVNIDSHSENMVFYKSPKSERWWLEITNPSTKEKNVIACSIEDYKQACLQEIPERWWKYYQKIY